MRDKIELFLALAVAALWSDIFDRATWYKARALFTVWFGSHGARVTEEHFSRRMAACRACPVFYAPLQTCGSPLSKETRGLGCSCHLPSKARLEAATCWLDNEAPHAEYGWREQ